MDSRQIDSLPPLTPTADDELNQHSTIIEDVAAKTLAAVAVDQNLTKRQRSDRALGVRTIAAMLACETISCDPDVDALVCLDEWLTTKRSAASSSLKAHISRFRAAVRDAGFALPNGWGRVALRGAWSDLAARTPIDVWARLLDLPEWAQRAGQPPTDVDAARFHDWEQHRAMRGNKEKSERQRKLLAADTWRWLAEPLGVQFPVGWPRRHDTYRYVLPAAAWSAEFTADVRDTLGRMIAWRENWKITSAGYADHSIKQIYRIATLYCMAQGIAPSALRSIKPLLCAHAAQSVADVLFTQRSAQLRAGRSVQAYQFVCLLCALAASRDDLSEKRMSELEALRLDIAPGAEREISSDKQARLYQFWSDDAAARLRGAASHTLQELNGQNPKDQRVYDRACTAIGLALIVDYGLMPSQLCRCVLTRRARGQPKRLLSADAIACDGKTFTLSIAATRRGGPRQFELSRQTEKLVVAFLERFARNPRAEHLLARADGTPRDPTSLGRRICHLISAHGFKPIHASDFPALPIIVLARTKLNETRRFAELLGYRYREIYPLFETIKKWRSADIFDHHVLRELKDE